MWHDVLGHDEVAERFRQSFRNGRLAGTYLFAGPEGIGKRLFAMRLAQALLCGESSGQDLEICHQCESCRLAESGNHPDLMTVALPPDKSKLPIELFVGDREHRNQTGLCHHLSLKPFLGGRRIAIIDDADFLSQESANCLLKTLEEPPPESMLVLIGTSPSRQLPTIRSRSQLVRFAPLSESIVRDLILRTGIAENEEAAAQLAAISEGSLTRARELADPALTQFRRQFVQRLDEEFPDSVRITQAVLEIVDEAGKEAATRRARLKIVLQFAAEFYRDRMRTTCSASAANRLDHCLVAIDHLARNANQAGLVHWWAAGLSVAETTVAGPV